MAMGEDTKVYGKEMRKMARVHFTSRVVTDTKVLGNTVRRMETALCIIAMVGSRQDHILIKFKSDFKIIVFSK